MTELEYEKQLGLKDMKIKDKEVRIAELEDKLANADYQLEGRDNEIRELEKENEALKGQMSLHEGILWNDVHKLEKENAELRAIAENQQSSNMSRYFENKKLKEGIAVGSTLNKGLNSLNKALEEERDKYRNMVFDKDEHLTNAKEIIKLLLWDLRNRSYEPVKDIERAEQFLSEWRNDSKSRM